MTKPTKPQAFAQILIMLGERLIVLGCRKMGWRHNVVVDTLGPPKRVCGKCHE